MQNRGAIVVGGYVNGLGIVRALAARGIAHEHEEYDDGHMNVSYRYDVSLPKLIAALGE